MYNLTPKEELNVGEKQGLAEPLLGDAEKFVILSKAGITNVPTSAITGNIGTSPITGEAITALPCTELTGSIYTVDAVVGDCIVEDAG